MLLKTQLVVGDWQEIGRDGIGRDGIRPPPNSRFSFNKIDRERALLFGGRQDKYTVVYKDVYILDLETKVGLKKSLAVFVESVLFS